MARTSFLVLALFMLLPICSKAQAPHSPDSVVIMNYVDQTRSASDTAHRAGPSDDYIEVVAEPMLLHPIDSDLHYPAEAVKAKVSGDVIVGGLVEEDGTVSKVMIQRSASPLLNDEALRLMKQAQFAPAMSQEKPVRVWVSQKIHFTLPQ